MKNETKLGLVFIGILLTIFVALLMKRLARPGNAVLAALDSPRTRRPIRQFVQARPPRRAADARDA